MIIPDAVHTDLYDGGGKDAIPFDKHDFQERMEDLISFLDEQTEAVEEYSEALARRLIKKITVYDEKLVVEFKSGLTVEVEV